MITVVIMAAISMMTAMVVIIIMGVRYEKEWTKNFELDVSFSEEWAGEGESLYLYETITNNKQRILPSICVKFKTSRYLAFDDGKSGSVSDYYYRNDVISVRGFERVRRKLRFRCTRRGEYLIEEAELVGNDYFLRQRYVEKRALQARLVVYPSFVGTEKIVPLFQKGYGEMATRVPLFEDPFEYVGVREYLPGDTMEKINWKASARTGRWQVRTSAYTAGEPALVVLNLESPGTFTNYNAMEENIRIAYSLIYYLDARGIVTTLLSNGSDGLSLSGRGRAYMAEVRRRLAVIAYEKLSGNGTELLQKVSDRVSANHHVFFISSAGKQNEQQMMTNLIKRGIAVTWVATIFGGEDDTGDLLPGMESCLIRWKG